MCSEFTQARVRFSSSRTGRFGQNVLAFGLCSFQKRLFNKTFEYESEAWTVQFALKNEMEAQTPAGKS